MERYDYLTNVIEDVKNVVTNEYDYMDELLTDRDGFEQRLNDELWTKDSVTGNGSGSYTFNAWQAEEYLCHNLDLLGQAITTVLDELEAEIESEE